MWRYLFAAAVVSVVGGQVTAQGNQPQPDKPLTEAEQKEQFQKKWAVHLKKYPTEVSDLEELAKTSSKKLADLVAAVKVSDEDKPAVRAAKRVLLDENERRLLLEKRIRGGHIAGCEAYLQVTGAAVGMYEAATLIWSDPEKLLPFAECLAAEAFKSEEFTFPRALYGLEEPQLLPQVVAARLRAEVPVLQLREQVKKK